MKEAKLAVEDLSSNSTRRTSPWNESLDLDDRLVAIDDIAALECNERADWDNGLINDDIINDIVSEGCANITDHLWTEN